MEYIWAPFLAIFWYFVNRLTGKTDDLEKQKANNTSLGRVADHARELDKRIDELTHLAIPRSELQLGDDRVRQEIRNLHERVNLMERSKADRIKNIRVHTTEEKKPNG